MGIKNGFRVNLSAIVCCFKLGTCLLMKMGVHFVKFYYNTAGITAFAKEGIKGFAKHSLLFTAKGGLSGFFIAGLGLELNEGIKSKLCV